MKILYVDDDDDIRDVAELSLQMDPDIEVRTAASGAQALALFAHEDWRPDAILLDVMMPDMDGPTTLAKLREGGEAAPAIFVTARALASEIDRLLSEGAVGVITKPFDPIKFAAGVRRILGA